jgi:hypothetical protein
VFSHATRRSALVGAVLSSVHLAISWWVIIWVARSGPDAQWQLIWVYFWFVDFPVTLLWFLGCMLLPNWHFATLGEPIGSFRGFLLPAFVFGIAAPAWYFALPLLISGRRRGGGKRTD